MARYFQPRAAILTPAGLSAEFRPWYTALAAAGTEAELIAAYLTHEAVKPLVASADRPAGVRIAARG